MRTRWLDVCKGLGIVAVYYGHVVGRFGGYGVTAAVTQWTAIYAFHMPLFFLLSGYLHKTTNRSAVGLLKRRARRLVYPIWFFNLMFLLVSMAVVLALGQPLDLAWYGRALLSSFLTGEIRPCGLTWFLYCLMSVFVLHTLLGGWAKTGSRALLLAVASGGFGYWVTHPEQQANPAGALLRIWYLDEAFVAYAFFLVGHALRRWEAGRSWTQSTGLNLAVVVACAAVFLVTLDWNEGPFRAHLPGVVMAQRGHGGLAFFLTAVAGSLVFLYSARLIGRNRPLEWIGVNSIPFFALNSAFYGWLNPPLVRWWKASFGLPRDPFDVFGWVGLVTLASLLATAPLVWLLGRMAPTASGASRRPDPDPPAD